MVKKGSGSGSSRKSDKNQNIVVAARCRPMNSYEMKMCSPNSVDIDLKAKEITVRQDFNYLDKGNNRTFQFDKVFGPKSKQIDLYRQMVCPVIDEVLQGYNCTIFAYGQTGTGKTFTMEGERSTDGDFSWQEDPLAGIIPRALHQLFSKLNASEECAEFSVRVSFLEIYNEELFDLLGNENLQTQKLRLFEDPAKNGSIVVQGLEEVIVHSRNEVYGLLEKGTFRRQTAATLLNAHSSRSHSLFMVTIHMKENNINGEEFLKTGKLNLVDLAGSENIGRSGAVEKRAREAGTINQSLLTLGRVITALVENAPHVPYRESKLTRLLKDSLGGRTKTSIIATISPAACNLEETLSTLDYASRAKHITNKPEVNQKLTKKALIKEYTEQIEKLKKDLHAAREKNGIYMSEDNYLEMQNQITCQKTNLKEYIDNIQSLEEEKRKTEKLFSRTQRILNNANMRLDLTRQAVLEKTIIVEKQKETEDELYSSGTDLLETVNETVVDNEYLHQSLDRKSGIHTENVSLCQLFKNDAQEKLEDLSSDVHVRSKTLISFQSDMKSELDNFRTMKNTAYADLSSAINTASEALSLDVEQFFEEQTSYKMRIKEEKDQFQDELTKIQGETLKIVAGYQNTFSSMMEKFRNCADTMTRHVDRILTTQTDLINTFSTHSEEQLKTQNTQIKELADVIYDHTCTDKEQSDNLTQLMENTLLQQDEMKHQLKASFMESLQRVAEDGLNRLFDTQHKQLQSSSSQILSKVSEHNIITDQFQTVVNGHVCTINESGLYHMENIKTNVEKSVSSLSTSTSQMKTSLVTLNTEVLEFENEQIEMEEGLKTNIEHNNGNVLNYVDKIEESSAKQIKITEDRLNNLVSVNKDSVEQIVERHSVESEISNRFTADLMAKHQEHTDVGQGWCTECDYKLTSLEKSIVDFVDEGIKSDNPTGLTPKQKKYVYPKKLRRTEDHEKIIASYREQMGAAPLPPLSEDGEFIIHESEEESEADSSIAALNLSENSQLSGSSISPRKKSETDDGGSSEFTEEEVEEEDPSPYPTPSLKKTKHKNICIDGKENMIPVPFSASKLASNANGNNVHRTPLSTANH